MVTVNDQTFYKVLNQLLSAYSYVGGYQKSDLDDEILKLITKEPALPHLKRWYNHIQKTTGKATPKGKSEPKSKPAEEDDDIDLFGSDSEVDEEAEKLKEARLAEYRAKKEKKPKVIAKSMVTLDCKPWDDTTDLEEMLKLVKSIEMEGLVWGQHKFVAIGFGIKKLQINCVVEDDKVSIEELSEKIVEFEDFVQSVDTAAFMKL
eukprot:NODE_163_length_16507_cov_1.031814.p8 type:complete len:205 gc:universal NODE_163_length_16507_cov_1.031814:11462-10848(-)